MKEAYNLKEERIKERLEEFRQIGENADDERLFQELSFCVLTANTSAKMCINAIEEIEDDLLEGNHEDLAEGLSGVYRYPNKRSEYIIHNREKLKEEHDFKIRELLNSFDNSEELRDWLADNIKGLGYKESSHFLRNIGYQDLAILDKHILRSLEELGVIEEAERPKNKEEYERIEEELKEFSEEVGIGIDELDLLLWSLKNGEILK